MFASVIIVLPSRFTGGDAHLSHGGQTMVLNSSLASACDTTVLAWYTDDWSDAHRLKCRVGSCIAIKDGVPHHFMDGRTGFRIEDPATVEVPVHSFSRVAIHVPGARVLPEKVRTLSTFDR